MASFDFVECTTQAFRFVWQEREEVMRLSAMVLAIKVVSFVALIVFGLEGNVLRQGLVLIPSYYIEGCVVVRLIAMAAKVQERMPVEDLRRNLQGAAIVYLLTKMALSFVMGMTSMGRTSFPDTPPPDPTLQTFVGALFLMLLMIWSFRLLWLYVPMVLGFTPLEFVNRFRAFSSSFYMIGAWILCFVPLALAMIVVAEVLGMIFPSVGEEASMPLKASLSALQAVTDYAMALVSSIAIAYGISSVFNKENKTTSLF